MTPLSAFTNARVGFVGDLNASANGDGPWSKMSVATDREAGKGANGDLLMEICYRVLAAMDNGVVCRSAGRARARSVFESGPAAGAARVRVDTVRTVHVAWKALRDAIS